MDGFLFGSLSLRNVTLRFATGLGRIMPMEITYLGPLWSIRL